MLQRDKKRNRCVDYEDSEESEKSEVKPSIYLENNKYTILSEQVYEKIKEKNITIFNVYDLQNLPIDEYVWFKKYIDIRDHMQDYTEDKYNIENMIYTKYLNFKNLNHDKLKKIKIDLGTNESIINKIINSHHDDYTKGILYKKYTLFCENQDKSEESSKIIEWIETILNLPSKQTIQIISNLEISNKLQILHEYLNKNIYGLNEIKEKIMETMCNKILNPTNASGKILTLIGPPGVGKTWIASTIAEAMQMPFDQISFGSIQDSKILTGHSSTYIGAIPGLFTKILMKSKRFDTLVLFDEIDKITNTQDSNITSVLYHVLDKSQNNKFKDIYIPEIPLDLSQMLFICAANSLDNIDPILSDRMLKIHLSGYNLTDKTNICRLHLIPKFKNESGFQNNEIIIDDKEIEYIITNKTEMQPGMRNIERKIRELFERLALLKYSKNIQYSFTIKNLKFPLKITKDIIDKLIN